jgi:hypothetical protein
MPHLAAQQPVIPLAKPIKERYSPIRQVSGATLVGVLAGGSDNAVASNIPNVYIPGTPAGKLCLSIASRDGTYSATAEYSLNHTGPGIYALSFHSGYDNFKSFHMNDLASVAEVKDDCSSGPSTWTTRTILPVFWSDQGFAYPIHLLLQADEADTRLRASGPNAPSLHCSRPDSGAKITFDEDCVIPAAWKPVLKDPLEIDVSNFGDNAPPMHVLLAVP